MNKKKKCSRGFVVLSISIIIIALIAWFIKGYMLDFDRQANSGDVAAMRILAATFMNSGDSEQAYEWYLKAAEAGDDFAQLKIGQKYALDRSSQENDKTALSWFLKSASNGNYTSHVIISTFYKIGRGTDVDDDLSEAWLKKAKELKRVEKVDN